MMDIKIKEAYDTLKEVIVDVSAVVRSISQWKKRQLIDRYLQGLGAITLICLKVKAADDVAQRFDKHIDLTLEDRKEIVNSIITLSNDLNVIIESDPMRSLLGTHPQLAEKVYLKMYGEREDYGPADIWSDEDAFLLWVRAIPSYIEDVVKESDDVFK
jgi:hypothetical protein